MRQSAKNSALVCCEICCDRLLGGGFTTAQNYLSLSHGYDLNKRTIQGGAEAIPLAGSAGAVEHLITSGTPGERFALRNSNAAYEERVQATVTTGTLAAALFGMGGLA